MGKLLTEELALQLTERLLENDKTVNDKLQEKIDNVEKEVPSITATRNEENNGAVITVNSKKVTINDGTDGKDGFSPSVVEDENNTNDVYKLKITTKESVFTTPNLKGKNGDNSSTVGVSQESGNALVEKSDGFYVPSVNTSNFVEKEEGKGLFSGHYSDLAGVPIIPSTDGLATETYVDTKITEAQLDGGDVDLSGYTTKDELVSTLSDYAKKDDIIKYDDTDIKQSITDLSDRTSVNENAITTFRGTGEGSIKKSVDDALNKFATDLSDDGVVNTYKELIDYAATHGSDVVEMVTEIEQNTNAIKTLNEKVKDIDSEKISQWDAKSEFSGSYNDLKDVPESFPSNDVYDWAKQPTKPIYTASEVGALPADTDIPSTDGLASEDFVNNAIANAQLGGDADLSNYYTKSEVNEVVPSLINYRWKFVEGEVSPLSLYSWSAKKISSAADQYTSLRYVLNGEKKIKFSGANSGAQSNCAYAFLDSEGDVIKKTEWISMQTYKNVIVDVPDGAYEVRLNGNGSQSPHLEVAVEDTMADIHTLPYLLGEFGKKISYKENFAWKPMPAGHVAFTFDDSVSSTYEIVNLFISKGVPCVFGCIPEKLNMSMKNGETIAQSMQRGVKEVGCEVLAHGGYIVTEENIDDMNYLYEKFVIYKQKLTDFGFNVRGIVRTGGNGNICNDPRTDVWVKLLFDYSDLYGIEEPYNHARASVTATVENFKAVIDRAVTNKTFVPMLFHQPPEYLEELIDYAIEKGAVICNYAYVYDTYGSTAEKVELENKVKTLENNSGSATTPVKGVDYWTEEDVSSIKTECQNYIDTQLLGGAS